MQKHALKISAYAGVLGAFGSFFRWLQLQSAFDKETGLIKPSALNVLLPLILIGSAVMFYYLIKQLKAEGFEAPTDIKSTFRGTSIFYPIAFYAIAGITVIGGLAVFFTAGKYALPGAYRLIALLAILSGVTFPLICISSRKQYMPALVCIFMTLPIVMYCLWLIVCYKVSASNPTVWAYCIEVLTVCAVIIALYFTAGYPYGSAKPYRAIYSAILAAFMCIVSLADSRSFGLQLIMAGTAGMLIMEACMIICNMQEPVEKPEAVPEITEPEAEEVEAEETETETETVIDAGKAEATPEPTIQAPEYKPQLDDKVEDILKEYRDSSDN